MRKALSIIVISIGVTAAFMTPARGSDGDNASVAAALLDRAEQHVNAREWAEAETAYEALTRENPYNGYFWYWLGSARYNLKKYETSAAAYEEAARLGYERGTSLYNQACDYALMGETEKAVEALERSIRNGLRAREQLIRADTDFDAIRDSEAFRKRIFPAVGPETDRVAGWRTDLDYLTRRMEETHYDVYRNISREEWQRTVSDLKKDIRNLEDYEVVVRIMQLIARVGDGHTQVRTRQTGSGFHAIPVRFYIFKDGVFIHSAMEDHADIVGSRVVKVGKLPVEEALDRVATVTQRDNTQQIKWLAPRFMSIVEVLVALGVTERLDHVPLVLEKNGRERTVELKPVDLTSHQIEAQDSHAIAMNAGAVNPLPLCLKNLETNYWFEYLADERLVYFNFNSVRDENTGETLAQFSDRLFAFIDDNDVETLVVDVRFNHGGNNYLVKPLIDGIVRRPKINEKGRLFVITGRETFSACQNFCNRLEREAAVTFVGEPTGSRPNFVGEGNHIELPYSGLSINASSLYWQDTRSDDYRMWLAPELVAEVTSDDFRNNRDPAMATIRAYLDNRRHAQEGSSTSM